MSTTKTYTGGCHCGSIRYELTSELPTHSTTRCNCSWCLRTGFTSINLKPDTSDEFSQFKLVSPSSWDELATYSFGPGRPSGKYLCQKCGVYVFLQGRIEIAGNRLNHMGLNALTLDQGQGVDLRKWKIQYWDGLHDNFHAGLRDEPWEGGCW